LTMMPRDERVAVISPDEADEGTNALLIRPAHAMPFAFGPASYETHQRTAKEHGLEVGIYKRASISHDVDTFEDLQALINSGLLPS
jgi:2-phospho-L-lactate guanylyltransferase (CobY/MobA/RfbA family)